VRRVTVAVPFSDDTKILKAKPATNFPIFKFDELHVSTSGNYLIKGLIPSPGLTVVWGPPKCGKTFVVIDMALHVALGRSYRERRVRAGPVIYIACEGQQGFPARLEAFKQEHMTEGADAPAFYFVPVTIDLKEDVDRLIDDIGTVLEGESPAAVVIDTLNRSLVGSENTDEDMSAYIKAADKIVQAFECATIVIHHCGHEGGRPRGHSSLTGAVDAQISVSKSKDGTIKMKLETAKDLPDGKELFSRLIPIEVGIDEDGDPITSCVVE
jgi:RecA-family ATPase